MYMDELLLTYGGQSPHYFFYFEYLLNIFLFDLVLTQNDH